MPPLDPKLFYRRIEMVLDGVSGALGSRARARFLAPRYIEFFGDIFAMRTVQIYDCEDGGFQKAEEWGVSAPSIGREVEQLAPFLPVSPDAEHPTWTGVTELGATVLSLIGGVRSSVLAVGCGPVPAGMEPAAWLAQLSTAVTWVEVAFTQHLSRRQLENVVEQARLIQLSLLPLGDPEFGAYDIHAVSIPAQTVGGDVYDFVPLDGDTLAITVADASGHGLPAALQARDVVTGLRMGIEHDYKINRTIEKLNRVIHRSGLTSRFVSLVTGELELNGNFAYVNAGHPAPLLLDDRGLHELAVGGQVLGPFPEMSYKLGFAHVDRGAALALFSDGILEQGTIRGDAFGSERLGRWLRDWREGPAEAAIADLVARLKAHAHGAAFEDDVTVMLVRRPR